MANIPKTKPFPLFARFSRPFYTFCKRIFEQSTLPIRVRLLHLLECTLLGFALLRLASVAIQFNYGSQFTWDPLGQYLDSQITLYDGYLLACFVSLLLYLLLTNWQIFLGKKGINDKAHSVSWQSMVYDLTVRNADQAQQCRRLPQRSSLDLSQATSKIPLLRLLLHTIKSNLLQEQLDIAKLGHPRYQLAIFTFLSVNSRKKLLQFHFLANMVALLLPFLLSPPCFLGLTLHAILGVHTTVSTFSPFVCLLFLSDLTLLWIVCILFYRNVLLLLYFSMITFLAIRCHLQAGHRFLTYLMAKGRSSSFQSLNIWDRLLLRNFLTEHSKLCTLLDAYNGQFISLALFSAILLNVPTNIYLIYRLVYRQILLTEFTATFLITFGQIISIACAVVPLALANGALYRTGKYLPGVQLSVLRGARCRSLKFKYEILQSIQTESRVKSGATIGPLCLITFESLYKVVTLYAVYMLVFFDLLPK